MDTLKTEVKTENIKTKQNSNTNTYLRGGRRFIEDCPDRLFRKIRKSS